MDSLVVSPILQVVFDKLALLIIRKSTTRGDFKKEMQKLQDRLPIIQAVIEDAEERQHGDKKIKIWLEKLKDVAYDADDLLYMIHAQFPYKQALKSPDLWFSADSNRFSADSHMGLLGKGKLLAKEFCEVINSKVQMTCKTLESIPNYFINLRKLKKIRERLDDIAKEMGEFQLKEVLVSRLTQTCNREGRETGPHIIESEVCGRKEDVEKVVEMLLTSNPDVWIIPIIGIGGIGKTTLAQLAYNHERVVKHFDLKIWISLYDHFNPRKIMSEMLDYGAKGKYDSTPQIGLLQSQLREALCGKRYLLVLDDVWNEDPDEWDKVRNLLGDGTNGSKVIVTSRSQKVASLMSTNPPYHLEALSEDDCWALFKQRAFPDGDENVFPNLLTVGKQIIDKCKGVPLAAKVLGSLMRFKREESEWLRVQGSELWNLEGGENKILSVLKLSFNHLPSHLKRCFAYCAVFPKKFEISKEKLIHQWVAGGFVQCSPHDSVSTPEDIGCDYFNDLLRMSFLEVVSRSDESSTTRIKMHDLMHELAKSVAGNEFLTEGKTERQQILAQSHSLPIVCDSFTKTRHALVDCTSTSNLISGALYGAKGLRTLNLLSLGDASEKAIRNLISSFKYLRILNLSGFGIEKLHKSIDDLICLRYLDLSDTPIENLPASICNLQLQTLDLSGCNNLQQLPKRTRVMTTLRHLKIKNCTRLGRMPDGIGELINLQTLPIFISGQTRQSNIRQLRYLCNLRGELKIKHLENAIIEDSLLEDKQLDSLGLSWGDVDEHKLNGNVIVPRSQTGYRSSAQKAEGLLHFTLKPNSRIKKLFINGYPGTQFPDWMNSVTLCTLIQLELVNCKSCESLPALGELPLLKVLQIQGMDSVVNIGNEFFSGTGPFSSLIELSLRDFPKLKTLGANPVEGFARLNKLSIINCPVLITISLFPSLQHVEVRNCHPVILRCVAQLQSLSTLVIDKFPELLYIPKALIENNLLLSSFTISSCPKLRSLPANLGELQNLKLLKIGWFQELHSLPHGFENLTSLETLEIIECPNLVSLPEESLEGLSSLRSLSIENCHGLTSLPSRMQHATALERLTIMYCSNLASLPNGLQYLSALKSLSILSCTGLASLPEGLQFITTLQNLEIHDCPKVMELQAWVENLVSLRSLTISDCHGINSLPDGLQRLRGLQHLSIRGCPELEKRCERGKGEDWQKISHIPYIYVGSATLPQRRDTASSSSSS